MRVDGVLVWVDPIEDGRDRSVLDSLLRDVAGAGVFVSTHPDIILKLGTKEVLYRTRNLEWGSDTYLYSTMDQMIHELPLRLATGKARVLKQHRGNGGNGVWKVQLPVDAFANSEGPSPAVSPQLETIVCVRHAKRGCSEEQITLGEFYRRCEPYFSANGRMIDQEYQERLPEGMIRCYLVHDRVVGFGHQAINALFPAPLGAPSTEAPTPGPRLYYPPSMPEFQTLKRKLEHEWVPAVQRLLEIETESLPILWDCDFLLGSRETTAKTPMFFAKSTLVVLRRIPNLLCLTLSMRRWLGCRRRDRDAFRRAARRFKSVKEIKMLTRISYYLRNSDYRKMQLVSAIFCPFLTFLVGMAMTTNLEAEEVGH